MITTKLLDSLYACKAGITFFQQHFPYGKASFVKAVNACLKNDRSDYAAWLAQRSPATPGATWEVRLALQRNAKDRAYLARVCPDIPGATWEARLSLLGNNYDRTIFERLFPKPVRAALGKGKPNPNP